MNWVDVNGWVGEDAVDAFTNRNDLLLGPGDVNKGLDPETGRSLIEGINTGAVCGLALATPGPEDLALLATLKGLKVVTKAKRIKELLNAPKNISGVYMFTAYSGKTYVGSSGDIMRRLNQHLASGKLLPGDIASIKFKEVTGGFLERLKEEQRMINAMGGVKGDKLANKRNAMSVFRQVVYGILGD